MRLSYLYVTMVPFHFDAICDLVSHLGCRFVASKQHLRPPVCCCPFKGSDYLFLLSFFGGGGMGSLCLFPVLW